MTPFVNDSFGIDHPLIVVRDLDAAAERMERLGFVVTPRGRHPWGTHNRLCLFPGGLLELITIGEPDLVDANAVDHGLFGTFIRAFQGRGEGVAMAALHSRNLERDAALAAQRGIAIDGTIDFRRPVTLPDGTNDVAVVSLAMLTDRAAPQLSFFLCQQHKRGLVEVAAWRDHPNTATRLYGFTYLDDDAGTARTRFTKLWGPPVAAARGAGATFASPGGFVDVIAAADWPRRFPGLAMTPGMTARRPSAVAVAVQVASLDRAAALITAACSDALVSGDRLAIPPRYVGDTVVEFFA